MSYIEILEHKNNFYVQNKEKIHLFENIIIPILKKINSVNIRKKEKIKLINEFLSNIDKFYDIVFTSYNCYGDDFIENLKEKLLDFKKIPELKIKSEYIYDKYYDKQCKAFTTKNRRCANIIESDKSIYFCKTHCKLYIPKIKKIVKSELSNDITNICIDYIF